MSVRRWGGPALWVLAAAIAAVVVARARYVTDMSAFLPARPTPAERLLVEQLRDGPASRLILAAIDGGNAEERARISGFIAARLRGDRRFASINNGEPVTAQRDRDFLFEHRYVLSDRVTPGLFTVGGLHDAIADTVEDLSSPAGLLLKSLLPRDPTGEMMHVVDGLERVPSPATRDGVWASADGSRALLVAETAAGGSDTDAQQSDIAAIRAAFASSRPGALRLTLTGPGVFAVAARDKIERAAIRLSIASGILVVTLLFAAYRSVPALVLGLMPVATGALIGVAAVALGFGIVHGVTLGFGVTLIGESVDYSIYFFVSSRSRPRSDRPAAAGSTPSADWTRAWWPTIRLGMLTSVCGFASLLPSGFPGLAQLGAYSISGLIAAALVTRFVLPALLPRDFAIHDVAPLGARVARALSPARRLPASARVAAAAGLAAIALFCLYRHSSTLWNRELSALSPVSKQELDRDALLRADLGTADVSDLVIVTGPTLEAALAGAERVGAALSSLAASNVVGGYDSPAVYLPSESTQAQRRASLPGEADLRARLEQATAGLGLRADTLQPFVADVAAARQAAPLLPADLDGTSMKAALDALLLREGDRWNALLPLHVPKGAQSIDVPAVRRALGPAAQVIDLKAESDALYARYLKEAIHLSLAGLASLIALLALALRSVQRVVRVLAPLLLAVLCVAAALTLAGVPLTILHLVGMLLIVAVGSNYALFFDRATRIHEAGGESLTLAALGLANAGTVIGFGLLSFSQVPVLEALGTTVAPGAFLALVFSACLSSR
jgi:predicted exporter